MNTEHNPSGNCTQLCNCDREPASVPKVLIIVKMSELGEVSANEPSGKRILQAELRKIWTDPVEGFQVKVSDEDLFQWYIVMFGPPGTMYEGAYFKLVMEFPEEYPFKPPKIKFLQPMWHPNVYPNGDVCISILHNPDGNSFLPSECWNPTQTVRTVLLSLVSLLNEPNDSSPANVDASKQYREWKEGRSQDYEWTVREQVEMSKKKAEADGVTVPTTLGDYCSKVHTRQEKKSEDSDTDPLDEDSPPESDEES